MVHLWQVFSEYSQYWSPPAERITTARDPPRRNAARSTAAPATKQARQSEVTAEVTKLVQRMLGTDVSADQVSQPNPRQLLMHALTSFWKHLSFASH